jgi:hypothetical protein
VIIALLRRLFTRPTPTHCKCGKKADIIDTDHPWIVYCGKCYLRHIGKL